MVTRDRAENRDGPKVRGGRRGSRDPWSNRETTSLRPWVREEAGDAGLKGGELRGGHKEPGAGEEAAKNEERDRVRAGPAWAAETEVWGLGNGSWHLAAWRVWEGAGV